MAASGVEANFYRAINAVVEPAVRAGAGSPCVLPMGLIVLEATGRQSGAAHRLPLAGIEVGDYIIVGTMRGDRSQWIKNVRSNRDVRYWLRGKVRDGTAMVFEPGDAASDIEGLPTTVRRLAAALSAIAGEGAAPIVILSPRA